MTTDNTARAPSPTARPRCLSQRLDREWAYLNHRSEVLAEVRSWGLTDRHIRSLDDVLVLAGHRTEHTAEADQLLARLVGVARSNPLAARIVLQRILAGLLAIVRDEQERDPRVDAFDLIVGEAWISITHYRVETRPTYVAARLLNDARHRAFTCRRRRRVIVEVVTDANDLTEIEHDPELAAFDEVVAAVTEARARGLGDDSVATVSELLNRGSSASVAAARSVSTRAVRYRQRRAVTQIRRLVAA